MTAANGRRAGFLLAAMLAAWLPGAAPCLAQESPAAPPAVEQSDSRLTLEPCIDRATGTRILRGKLDVFENREAGKGRTIALNLVVLPATGPGPRPDPIFWLHGGPGVAATGSVRTFAASWMRRDRDIVLVDQRGTGGSNPLHVPLPGSDGNIQGYLDPVFQVEPFRAALPRLEKIADLARYTTPIAMDDLNEVRAALGYRKINLIGGSYGTRAALVYIRRHPETVRCAILDGVAPISFTNPLYHASAAQEGFETLCKEISDSSKYRRAFPNLEKKLWSILRRLEKKPVDVAIEHPVTKERVTVKLTRAAFAEALRIMMYYMSTNRKVPRLVLQAYEGDYAPFAQTGMMSDRGIRGIIHFGMLMCVTGSEDIPRIDPASIPRLTRNTFLGDDRVRRQMAVAAIWPRGKVPADYGEPVRSSVPVLLLSGTHDPVTPPRFAAEAARHLENSLHLVVPGAHGVGGPVVERIKRDFLTRGTVKGLDTSGIETMRLAPLEMPDASRRAW